jgi:hypothetical protein
VISVTTEKHRAWLPCGAHGFTDLFPKFDLGWEAASDLQPGASQGGENGCILRSEKTCGAAELSLLALV